MARPSSQTTLEWAEFTAVIGARIYRAMLLTLVAIAFAPLLLSWQAYVIKTASMEPSIDVGSVALARPFAADEKVDVGHVYMFRDPSADTERILVHRVVELRNEGDYLTQGDANTTPDTTPIVAEDITGRGILLVPYIGLPIVWMQSGQWVLLGIWLSLTVAAFFLAARNIEGEPPKWTMRRLLREKFRRTPRPPVESDTEERVLARGTLGVLGVRAVLTTLVLCIAGTTAFGSANATYTSSTNNVANTFTAGSWQLPYVAAVTTDNPRGFWLLDETSGTAVRDRSQTYLDGTTRDGTVTRGLPGAHTARNPGTSFRFAGGGALLHPSEITPPSSHTVELWFKTTSTQEGYLIGFEDQSTSIFALGNFNRTVHMDDGRIVVGHWTTTGRSLVTTPARYNNGAWHHLVVTSVPGSGSRGPTATIYLNGVQVAQGETSSLSAFNGQWQIGEGRRAGASFITPFPVERTFSGDIDAVAVYHSALSAARVKAHYDAR
ncbi:signal peptidase I [Nocardioides gilvus]|uniref:signal peptidase I n=1 Tax=Nocardioides gilvus TaxID=1735589 RepID=UPI000D749500|nr:signal peptidase I [Nocardioides gilvus]